MMDHTEGYLKAKELVEAINDIDYLLENYDYGIRVVDSGDKRCSLKMIYDHIRYIFCGKKEKYINFVEANSSISSEFMVDLHDFLIQERVKFEKKLRILE